MKIKIPVIIVILILFVAPACKKDNVSSDNTLNYDGQDYSISKVYLSYYGKHPVYTDSYFYNLVFISSTMNIAIDSNNNPVLTGKGNYLNIGLLYGDSLGLQLGKYYTYPDNNRKILGVEGGFNFDADISVGLKIIMYEDNYGEMTIGELDEESTFEFNMISAAEKQLTGNFKGEVEKLNPVYAIGSKERVELLH